ncbi:MAG: hypothetical protein CFH31_01412, partial [Alphaproteobacteria bacterium MarineAlpha9_Bin1]
RDYTLLRHGEGVRPTSFASSILLSLALFCKEVKILYSM